MKALAVAVCFQLSGICASFTYLEVHQYLLWNLPVVSAFPALQLACQSPSAQPASCRMLSTAA